MTQFFQFIRGYGPLSTGARILPVAVTIALGSVLGVAAASRIGTRVVVMTGLLLLGSSFAWIAVAPIDMPYAQIVGQMVLMGLGLGMTTAPATESILSVLPPAKAGVGSAVNDATREAGGTLGVAVLGSIFTSLYANHLADTSFARLPHSIIDNAQNSIAAALQVVGKAPDATRASLLDGVQTSFLTGFHVACVVGALICLAGAMARARCPAECGRTRRRPPRASRSASDPRSARTAARAAGTRTQPDTLRLDHVARLARIEEDTMAAAAPGIERVGQLALRVRDADRATRFYRDVLGLEHLYTFGDLVFFDCAGTRLYLHRVAEPDWLPGSVVYFAVPDIDGAYRGLTDAGVGFAGAPHLIHRHDSGTEEWMAFFDDGEGNPLR